jgi:hypothetical protein
MLMLSSSLMLSLAACVAIGQAPPPGFSTQGTWHYSSLTGPDPNKRTLWSSDSRATVIWNPNFTSYGPVRISFYVVAYKGNVPTAQLVVVHNGQKDSKTISMQSEQSSWVDIGTFNFSGTPPEYVQVSHAEEAGNLRIAALRMEVLDPSHPNVVWQNLVLDELVPGSQGTNQNIATFADMGNSPAAHSAGVLVGAKILPGIDNEHFGPEKSFSPADLSDALSRMGKANGLLLTSSSLSHVLEQHSITGLQFLVALVEAARGSGKNLDWLHANGDQSAVIAQQMGLLSFDGGSGFPSLTSVNRAYAAMALFDFEQSVVESGPPVNSKWTMSFDDEFSGNSVDWGVWNSDHGQLRGLSTRWPENAVVSNGLLDMIVRQEHRGGADWTAANLWTKNFSQEYGYWEARFRYAGATGLNNAFWMMHDLDPTKSDSFEIDVNEGHYPNEVNSTLHQNGMPDDSTLTLSTDDLSQYFHTYGCLWDQKQIIFYMDGKEIARKPNARSNGPVPVILSTAVISWAGVPHPGNLNGKSMDVDWVRVYTHSQ